MHYWYQKFIATHPVPEITPNDLASVRAWIADVNAFIDIHLQPHPSAGVLILSPNECCIDNDISSSAVMNIKQSLSLRTYAYERILIGLFEALQLTNQAALFAVGGFGRAEMLPYSDVDMLVIYQDSHLNPNSSSTLTQSPLHRFAAQIWDIGITPAISLRHISDYDCVNDITIATSLLESRHLAGLSDLQNTPKIWVKTIWTTATFFAAKIQEAKERHARFGYSEHSLEPNIKEGVGGLRDIHLLKWLAAFHFDLAADAKLDVLVYHQFLTNDEYQTLICAQRFFWTIRHHLHTIAKKGDNKLDFGAQKTLAQRMGYGATTSYDNHAPESLMKDYYHHAMSTAGLSVMLSQLFYHHYINPNFHKQPINDDFVIIHHHNNPQEFGLGECTTIGTESIAVCNEQLFDRRPAAMLELFLLMATNNIKHIAAETLRLLRIAAKKIDDGFRQNTICQQLFIANLAQPNYLYHRLYLMKYTGVLGAYLPEFGKIMGLMQYDLFHRYTVDAHTLLLIRLLHRFGDPSYSEFNIAYQIYSHLNDKLPLVIAALFHDIAKGRGGDHSELGAILVDKFCTQHAIADSDRKLIVWLVRHHLAMSVTAQKKDIFDPAIINEFADFVGDVRHLDHLYLLTVADMNATNSQLWNNWRATLLRKLYLSCHYVLSCDDKKVSPQTLIDNKKTAAYAHLDKLGIDNAAVQALWQNIPPDYFLKESSDDIAWHTQAILHHQAATPLVSIRPHYDKHLHAHQLLIYTPNQNNLFAKTVAILDKFGYSVYGANILTTHNNYALDSYVLVNDMVASTTVLNDSGQKSLNDQPLNDNEKQALITSLTAALTQNTNPNHEPTPKLIAGRVPHKHFSIITEISFEPISDSFQHYLHLITKDRTSLLAKIGAVFSRLDVWVHAAKITTLGERAEDIFCVSDKEDTPLSSERRQQIKDALRAALDG